jgi:hypothetical protein
LRGRAGGRNYMRDDGVVRREEGCRVASADFWLAGSQPYPPGHYVPTSGILDTGRARPEVECGPKWGVEKEMFKMHAAGHVAMW